LERLDDRAAGGRPSDGWSNGGRRGYRLCGAGRGFGPGRQVRVFRGTPGPGVRGSLALPVGAWTSSTDGTVTVPWTVRWPGTMRPQSAQFGGPENAQRGVCTGTENSPRTIRAGRVATCGSDREIFMLAPRHLRRAGLWPGPGPTAATTTERRDAPATLPAGSAGRPRNQVSQRAAHHIGQAANAQHAPPAVPAVAGVEHGSNTAARTTNYAIADPRKPRHATSPLVWKPPHREHEAPPGRNQPRAPTESRFHRRRPSAGNPGTGRTDGCPAPTARRPGKPSPRGPHDYARAARVTRARPGLDFRPSTADEFARRAPPVRPAEAGSPHRAGAAP